MTWLATIPMAYEEAVFVVESAPSLKSQQQLDVEEDYSGLLEPTHPQLLVEQKTCWKGGNKKVRCALAPFPQK